MQNVIHALIHPEVHCSSQVLVKKFWLLSKKCHHNAISEAS